MNFDELLQEMKDLYKAASEGESLSEEKAEPLSEDVGEKCAMCGGDIGSSSGDVCDSCGSMGIPMGIPEAVDMKANPNHGKMIESIKPYGSMGKISITISMGE